MTTPALERVRGLAARASLDGCEISVTATANAIIVGDVNVTDCHDLIISACNYLRSDEFDALVRDAMRYRWLRDKATREQFSDMAQYNLRPHLDYLIDKELQAIDAERGVGDG